MVIITRLRSVLSVNLIQLQKALFVFCDFVTHTLSQE
ncbi:hypothetical protein X975_02730, partial [Stegodyphus mimosarum]